MFLPDKGKFDFTEDEYKLVVNFDNWTETMTNRAKGMGGKDVIRVERKDFSEGELFVIFNNCTIYFEMNSVFIVDLSIERF